MRSVRTNHRTQVNQTQWLNQWAFFTAILFLIGTFIALYVAWGTLNNQ
jgi:hypothetical protein